MKEYLIDVRVKNNLILRKITEKGFKSISEFSTASGIGQMSLYRLINLKGSPLTAKGVYVPTAVALCEFLKCMPEELFTPYQMEMNLKTNKRTLEVNEAEMKFFLESTTEANVLENVIGEERETIMADIIGESLEHLTDNERTVIEMRFGLKDGITTALEAIAQKLSLSRERIRQIEAKALRKLRNQSVNPHHRSAAIEPRMKKLGYEPRDFMQ